MAALASSHRHLLHSHRRSAVQKLRNRSSPRSTVLLCCQNQDPSDSDSKTQKKGNEMKQKISGSNFVEKIEKMGKELKAKMSPQRKGDWKDLTLMSLSFAVYVYISQKIVCAYFAWMSIPKHLW